MAEVVKATARGDAGFERTVAIKCILPNLSEDADFVSMFVDEAKDKFEPVRFKAAAVMTAAALVMLIGIVWLGPLTDYALAAAQSFTFAK